MNVTLFREAAKQLLGTEVTQSQTTIL